MIGLGLGFRVMGFRSSGCVVVECTSNVSLKDVLLDFLRL